MQVTKDKYELPLVIADSLQELAEKANKPVGTINTSICRSQKKIRRKNGDFRRYPFRKVAIDDD